MNLIGGSQTTVQLIFMNPFLEDFNAYYFRIIFVIVALTTMSEMKRVGKHPGLSSHPLTVHIVLPRQHNIGKLRHEKTKQS